MLAMLLRKLAMLSNQSKVIQKDNRRSKILKGLMIDDDLLIRG